jgi:hypothetical protein
MTYRYRAGTACAILLLLAGAAAAMDPVTLDAGVGAWVRESGFVFWAKSDFRKEENKAAPMAALSLRVGTRLIAYEGSVEFLTYRGHYTSSSINVNNRIPFYLIPTRFFKIYLSPDLGFGHGWYPVVTPDTITGSEFVIYGVDAGVRVPLPDGISSIDVSYRYQRIKDNQDGSDDSFFRRGIRAKGNVKFTEHWGVNIEGGTIAEELLMVDETSADAIYYYTRTLNPASPYLRIGPSYSF